MPRVVVNDEQKEWKRMIRPERHSGAISRSVSPSGNDLAPWVSSQA
jgi:hypothetical protein